MIGCSVIGNSFLKGSPWGGLESHFGGFPHTGGPCRDACSAHRGPDAGKTATPGGEDAQQQPALP